MDQQEQTTAPTADSFQVLAESQQRITGQVKRCYFNFCHNILELDIAETKDFAVLNWVAGLAREEKSNEIVTFMALDEKGNILCMLRFTELTLLDHETTFNVAATDGLLGDKVPVLHTVHLKFEVVERVNKEPNIGGLAVFAKLEQKDENT